MKTVLLIAMFILLLIGDTHGQITTTKKVAEIKAEDVEDLALCMEQDMCKEPVKINPTLGEKRSGFVLRHHENGVEYVYVLTRHRTIMVMIGTKEGNFLLDDLFLNGVVVSGFFIPKNGGTSKQYPEKIKTGDDTYEISTKDSEFFQTPYKEAIAIALDRFVDKKSIRRKKPKPREYI